MTVPHHFLVELSISSNLQARSDSQYLATHITIDGNICETNLFPTTKLSGEKNQVCIKSELQLTQNS